MKVHRPPLLLAIASALIILANACVDETGYRPGCPLCVDETGYLRIDQVLYTAPEILATVRRPITVIGLPGALPGVGTLEVTGADGDAATVVGPDDSGAFRAQLSVALDDEMTFRFTPAGGEPDEDRIVIRDGLDAVTAPEAGGSAELLSSPDENGLVTLYVYALENAAPPFVVFNADATDPAVVYSDTLEDVRVPAGLGDRVCVFHVRPDEDAQSTEVCAFVPFG